MHIISEEYWKVLCLGKNLIYGFWQIAFFSFSGIMQALSCRIGFSQIACNNVLGIICASFIKFAIFRQSSISLKGEIFGRFYGWKTPHLSHFLLSRSKWRNIGKDFVMGKFDVWFWQIAFFSFFRHRAIMYPLRQKLTKAVIITTICSVWICSGLLALPALLYSKSLYFK